MGFEAVKDERVNIQDDGWRDYVVLNAKESTDIYQSEMNTEEL